MTDTIVQSVEVPDSPVGGRVSWLVDALSSEREVTADEISEAFDEAFLAQMPAAAVAGMFNSPQVANTALGALQTPSEYAAVVDMVPDGDGLKFRMKVMVDQAAPHRIVSLGVDAVMDSAPGAMPRDWSELSGGAPVRHAYPGANAVEDEAASDLEELIDEAREEAQFVGLAASVGGPDGLVWFRGFGQADSAGRAVEADTVFRIGSVSKTMTAIGILQLVEAGNFGLDDAVNEVLKGYRIESPEGSPTVTVRHLLTHTSGIDPRPVDIGVTFGEPVPPLTEFYAGGLKAERPVGPTMVYSNDAFATLGQIIEEQRGKPFPEAMHETLFAPLGMGSTSFTRDAHLTDRLVTGYNADGESVVETLDRDIIVLGAGSVYSTAEDMAKYTACLLASGAPVLQRETLESMWAAQDVTFPDAFGKAHMGLAFIVHDFDGERVVWHNGGWPGAATSMWAAPEAGRSVVLTANLFGPEQSARLDKLGKDLIARLLGGAPAE